MSDATPDYLDFEWMAAELARTDVYTLLALYTEAPEEYPAEAMRMVAEALRLGATALAQDPNQLAGQLLGRLASWDRVWGDLPEQAAAWEGANWQRPLQPALTPAGGPLLAARQAHPERVLSLDLLAEEARMVSSGWNDPALKLWSVPDGELLGLLEGHAAGVSATLLSEDGRVLVSGDQKGEVRTWAMPEGTPLLALGGHEAMISALALDLEADLLCAADEAGRIIVRELGTGTVLHALAAHKGRIPYLVLRAEAGQLCSAGDDRRVRLWDLGSGKMRQEWSGLEDRPVAMLETEGAGTVLFGDRAGVLRGFDLDAEEALPAFAGHGSEIGDLCWLGADGRFASASADRTVKLWGLGQTAAQATLEGHAGQVMELLPNAEGTLVVSAGKDDAVIVWDVASTAALLVLAGHDRGANRLRFCDEEQTLITADFDGTLRLWRLEDGTERALLVGHTQSLCAQRQTSDEALLISGDGAGQVRIWRPDAPPVPTVGHGTRPWAMLPLPAARAVASGAEGGSLLLWNSADGSRRAELAGHTDKVTLLRATEGEQTLISGSFDGTAKAWDTGSGELRHDFAEHTQPLMDLLVTVDGRLVTASSDKEIKVWDVAEGSLLHTLTGHAGGLVKLGLVDKQTLVSLDNGGALKLWDLAAGALRADLSPAAFVQTGFRVTSDGRFLLATSLSTPRALLRWQLGGATEAVVMGTHENMSVPHLLLTGDGKTAVTGSGSGEVKVWDVEAGTPAHDLTGHAARIDQLLLLEAEGRLVSAAMDGAIKVWELGSGALLHEVAGHQSWIPRLLAVGNGRFVSADGGGLIKLWDSRSGELMATFAGHGRALSSLFVSANPAWLVSASADCSVRVWGLETGEQWAWFALDQPPFGAANSGNGEDFVVMEMGGVGHFLRPTAGGRDNSEL